MNYEELRKLVEHPQFEEKVRELRDRYSMPENMADKLLELQAELKDRFRKEGMDDPTQIKPGDVVIITEADYPGVCMVTKVGDHDGDRTRINYRRLLGLDLRKITSGRERFIKLRYARKINRRQIAKMFENVRSDLNEAESIVSDAMFEGMEYVKNIEE